MKFLKISTIAILLIVISLISLMASEITLPGNFKKAYVGGTITSGGKPLTDVQVMAYGESGMAMAINASNGNYALGLGEGKWTVNASKTGYYMVKPIQISLAGDEAKENINIEMVKSAAYIKGQVVDEANKPIPNAFVVATHSNFNQNSNETTESSGDETLDTSSFQAKCDNKGYFTLQTTKGTFLLMAVAPKYELSPKNPLPDMMKDIPEEYRKNMPGMGVEVKVAEGETKSGVIIIMRPVAGQTIEDPNSQGTGGHTSEKPILKPMANKLIGKAMNTPNNVLHWTRSEKGKEYPYYVVMRSTRDFSDKIKGEVKIFDFTLTMYGEPASEYYSFTDNTAVSGQTYWYVVYEKGTSGDGPYSNSVKITTK